MNHQDPIDYLEHHIPGLLERFSVPGAGVTVIQGGETLFTGGFGFRNREEQLPVDGTTVFPIGSVTKSFTALLLGILVQRGSLSWETPVQDILPEFRLKDPAASAQVRVADLLSHQTGLMRHDLLWFLSDFSSKELFRRFRYLESFAPPRGNFRYSNLMYMAAGMLAEKITGGDVGNLLAEEILKPLGMTSATAFLGELKQKENRSLGYASLHDAISAIPYRDSRHLCAAGMLSMSMEDLARWILFNLGDGAPLVSKNVLESLHTPRVMIPREDPLIRSISRYGDVEMLSYAMGWLTSCHRGELMVAHGGQIDGFTSMLALLPRRNSGVAVVANRDDTPLPMVVMLELVDRLLDLPARPWTDRLALDTEAELEAAKGRDAAMAALHGQGAEGVASLEEYGGAYHHPAYGTIEILPEEGGLKGIINSIPLRISHWHHHVFLASPEWVFPEVTLPLSFLPDLTGGFDRIEIPDEEHPEPLRFCLARP